MAYSSGAILGSKPYRDKFLLALLNIEQFTDHVNNVFQVETLRAAIQYIKHLQGLLGIDQNAYVESEDREESSSKDTLSPAGSEQEKLSEDNFAKYLEEEERFSATSSTREEHSSPPSVDTEDSLVSCLSPKVKIEVPSPSDFLQTSENSFHRQSSTCEFPLKGTIICKTSQTNMKPQEFKANWKQRNECHSIIESHTLSASFPYSSQSINFRKVDPNIFSAMTKVNSLSSSRTNRISDFNESTSKANSVIKSSNFQPNQKSTQQGYWSRKQEKLSNRSFDINFTKYPSTSNFGTVLFHCLDNCCFMTKILTDKCAKIIHIKVENGALVNIFFYLLQRKKAIRLFFSSLCTIVHYFCTIVYNVYYI